MRVTVDAIEGGIVRFEREDRTTFEVTLEDVPFSICRGDVLIVENNQIIAKDDAEKQRRAERIRRMRKQIMARQKNT